MSRPLVSDAEYHKLNERGLEFMMEESKHHSKFRHEGTHYWIMKVATGHWVLRWGESAGILKEGTLDYILGYWDCCKERNL